MKILENKKNKDRQDPKRPQHMNSYIIFLKIDSFTYHFTELSQTH